MTGTPSEDGEWAERARAWRTSKLVSVCDVIEPWAHGTVCRATRYPSFFEFNIVRVQEQVSPAEDDLLAVADRALAGLTHRLIEFDFADSAAPLRGVLESRGWRTNRLLWLCYAGDPRAPTSDLSVEEAPYDSVANLRVRWHHEDFPGDDPTAFHAMAREVEQRHGARVLVVRRGGRPVAFAQLDRLGSSAEIGQVYVLPEHRGQGLGTAVTGAAIRASAGADELWICADHDGRARTLYERLGFCPAWTTVQFLLMPRSGAT